jgi:hypothetical protein
MRFAHDVLNIIIDSTYNRLCRIPHNGICERRGVRLPPATHPVIHCVSEPQARFVRDAVARRLVAVGLELHPDKTRIVYCREKAPG